MSNKEQVRLMFNNIAKRYDFLNHFLSLGIDIVWRKKAIRILKKLRPNGTKTILDIATGTGDFAIEGLSLSPEKVTGIDISEKMLEVGKEKLKRKKLEDKIELLCSDSENLPFADNTFDAITVGFGVRNFENLEKGLSEMFRALNNGGVAVILEFSKPKQFPVKQLYNFYFFKILPLIGKIISKDNSAYSYLPESVKEFPDGNDLLNILAKAGFKQTQCIPLTMGVASIYTGKKL